MHIARRVLIVTVIPPWGYTVYKATRPCCPSQKELLRMVEVGDLQELTRPRCDINEYFLAQKAIDAAQDEVLELILDHMDYDLVVSLLNNYCISGKQGNSESVQVILRRLQSNPEFHENIQWDELGESNRLVIIKLVEEYIPLHKEELARGFARTGKVYENYDLFQKYALMQDDDAREALAEESFLSRHYDQGRSLYATMKRKPDYIRLQSLCQGCLSRRRFHLHAVRVTLPGISRALVSARRLQLL